MRYEINNRSEQLRRFGGVWVAPGETKTVTMRPIAAMLVAKWRRAGVIVREVTNAAPEPAVAGYDVMATVPSEPHAFDPPTANTWEPRESHGFVGLEGWEALDWSRPDESGRTLRGVAAAVSKHPIRTRADAEAAIQAELARRDGNGATDIGAL